MIVDLKSIVSTANTKGRLASLQQIADLLRTQGGFRWVGLYDVDHETESVTNVVWSGPGPPEYPVFPITRGLTAAALADRNTVNVGDVSADPRYLTALGTTRSEMIVPIFDRAGGKVVGTIDVESEKPNAFSSEVQRLLEACSEVIRPLWTQR